MAPDQVEIEPLSSSYWTVRLRQGGYRALVDWLALVEPLDSPNVRNGIIAAIYEGLSFWSDRMARVADTEQKMAKRYEVFYSQLRKWPIWVIRAAFNDYNGTSEHPPKPVNIDGRCALLWGDMSGRIKRARTAVTWIEENKPEWTFQ